MDELTFAKTINAKLISQDDVFVVVRDYLKIDKDLFNEEMIGTYLHIYIYDVLNSITSVYQIVEKDTDGVWVKFINALDFTNPLTQWTKKVNGKKLRIYESNFNEDGQYGKYYVNLIDDVDENEGGFYVEIFDDSDRDNRVDYFCIHPEELEQEPDVSIHIYNYINSL